MFFFVNLTDTMHVLDFLHFFRSLPSPDVMIVCLFHWRQPDSTATPA